MSFEIATDGSAAAPKKTGDKTAGGWAFVVTFKDRINPIWQSSGYESATTISRMELTACIRALEWIVQAFDFPPEELTIVTDSSYVRNCFKDKWYLKWQSNGWTSSTKKPVANRDLWERLLALNDVIQPNWKHVKGHQGRHDGNERADQLAVEARLRRGK